MKQQVRTRKLIALRLEDADRLRLETIAQKNGLSAGATAEALVKYAMDLLGADARVSLSPSVVIQTGSWFAKRGQS